MTTGLGTLTLLGVFGGAIFGGGGPQPMQAFEVQQIRPTQPDRALELTNASWYVARTPIVPDRLEIQLGVTASRARGTIVQRPGSLEDGTLRTVELASSAWGIGPTAAATLKLIDFGQTRLNLDVAGSAMLYDRPFPSGGSRYNGMIQAGPSVRTSLDHGRRLAAGVRWTHISNGQGLGAHNPSFDGRGIYLQYERALGRAARARS